MTQPCLLGVKKVEPNVGVMYIPSYWHFSKRWGTCGCTIIKKSNIILRIIRQSTESVDISYNICNIAAYSVFFQVIVPSQTQARKVCQFDEEWHPKKVDTVYAHVTTFAN